MKKALILIFCTLSTTVVTACTTCNKSLQEAIFSSTFFPNLVTMLSAFLVLTVAVIVLTALASKQYKRHSSKYPDTVFQTPVPLITCSMVLGIGLGGFTDGILLHQVLQWHEMLSNKVAIDTVLGKSVNMFWDGIFHFFCLIVVLVGVVLLWKMLFRKDIERSGKLLSGGLLLGWGLFNIVEGIIDHHLLKLHNIRETHTNIDFWNFAFLGLSVIMLITGCALVYYRKPQAPASLNL